MYYLIYISAAKPGVDEVEMHEILTVAVKNNEAHDVTGLLVYHDGMFIQMLEGEKQDVELIFEKIQKDERHFDIRTLSKGTSEKRHFPNWRMALEVTHEKTFRQLEAFEGLKEGSDFLDGLEDNQIGIRLLRYFYTSVEGERP